MKFQISLGDLLACKSYPDLMRYFCRDTRIWQGCLDDALQALGDSGRLTARRHIISVMNEHLGVSKRI
jgi:hypothetical protein